MLLVKGKHTLYYVIDDNAAHAGIIALGTWFIAKDAARVPWPNVKGATDSLLISKPLKWCQRVTVNVFLSGPTPVIVRLFHFDGRHGVCWTMPSSVIRSPPKPHSTAWSMPPAPVAK